MTDFHLSENRASQPRLSIQIRKAKEIGFKTGRPWLLILLDMFFCALRYRTCYNDYGDCEFYQMHHAQRKTYITQGINHRMIRLFNQQEYCHWFNHKTDFNERFSPYLGREWLNLYLASQGDFIAFVKKHPVFFAKPVYGGGAERIDASSCNDFYALRQQLMAKDQFLIEECVLQHPALEMLPSNGLNTLRLITFSDSSGVHLLRAVLRIGTKPESGSAIHVFVDERGVVQSGEAGQGGTGWEGIPFTGTSQPGFRIPFFQEALRLVYTASREIPQIRYIGWDVAITPEGPALMGADPASGTFQPKASRCSGRICGDLPTYRLYMKI